MTLFESTTVPETDGLQALSDAVAMNVQDCAFPIWVVPEYVLMVSVQVPALSFGICA